MALSLLPCEHRSGWFAHCGLGRQPASTSPECRAANRHGRCCPGPGEQPRLPHGSTEGTRRMHRVSVQSSPRAPELYPVGMLTSISIFNVSFLKRVEGMQPPPAASWQLLGLPGALGTSSQRTVFLNLCCCVFKSVLLCVPHLALICSQHQDCPTLDGR